MMRRLDWMTLMMVGALLVVHGVARADVAMPRDKWTDISMVAEKVQIVLGAKKVTVKATFDLKNEEGAVTAVIGYPRGRFEKSLNDFTVTVDGKPVKVSSQAGQKGTNPRLGMSPRKKGGPVKPAYQFAGSYPEWKTFNVRFAAGQKRKLVVTYNVAPAELNTADNGKVLAYVYTLKTGANWKGKIKKAEIHVNLAGGVKTVTVTPNPHSVRTAGGNLFWRYKDFKPTHDIEITFRADETRATR